MIHLAFFYWDPNPEIFTLPMIHYPILWYGILFALGFILGFPIFAGILVRFFRLSDPHNQHLKKKAYAITDKLTLYMVIATVLGARIGHMIFYEDPAQYLRNPIEIFAVWKGGLASHGALVAILLALWLYSRKYRKELKPMTYIQLLDFISVPVALAGCFIRIGNFFNQEILGTVTNVPWAVIFGHPADLSVPMPRHPAQLYEAIFYLLSFAILWTLSFRRIYLEGKGKIGGLFLILIFGFRFVVEHWKLEQSVLIDGTGALTMGQILSILPILAGVWLFFRGKTIKI